MDINLMFAVLIALIPVFLTIIFSRLYNIIHGFITFIVMSFVLMFCLQADVFGSSIQPQIAEHLTKACGVYTAVNEFFLAVFANVPFISDLLSQNYGPYVALAAVAVVFIVSQIIACAIRKSRVEKIKSMKRQIKRY